MICNGARVSAAVVGETEIIMLFIVTVAEAVLVGSALLATVTVQVSLILGAVYKPPAVIEPQPLAGLTDQVTAVFVVPLPITA